MKLGIDARLYGTKHGGIGRYTQELIRNLLTISPDKIGIDPVARDYIFFVHSKEDEAQIRADIGADALSRIRFVLAPYRCYTLAEQIFMPARIARAKVDLMHFTHFNVPLAYRASFVVTIHDLIIHHFPDERATTLPKWLYKIKLWGYKKVIRHAMEKARVIIAPSEATKQDILRFYKIDEKKVKVVYEGVTQLRITNYELRITDKGDTRNPKPQPKIQISTTYNLQHTTYLLYVGSFYPHKNIERLIDAFYILRAKYKLDIKLVLVGKYDYFQRQIQKYITNHETMKQYSNDVMFYGYATNEALSELYQNATLFVFPSLYEGFGLPPLEAMSFGVSVVASNVSCVPEILGGAAIYCNPTSAEEIAEKIYFVYTSSAKQTELREKGYAQIQKYSWQKMAEETLQIYKQQRGCGITGQRELPDK